MITGEFTAINLENQVKQIKVDGKNIYLKDNFGNYFEYGKITEQTDKLIKGKTINGVFELIIKSK
jgi:hypothetical protein